MCVRKICCESAVVEHNQSHLFAECFFTSHWPLWPFKTGTGNRKRVSHCELHTSPKKTYNMQLYKLYLCMCIVRMKGHPSRSSYLAQPSTS